MPGGFHVDLNLSRFRGDPKALATALVILCVLCAAIGLSLNPKFDLVSSALMGAAVSTAVGSLIGFLQSPGDRKIPYQFIEGAKREVYLIRYYREDQAVHIDFIETEGSEPRIKIRFYSRLMPTDGQTTLEYPKINPPPGFTKVSTTYSVGGEVVSEDTQKTIHGPAEETLEVEYKVKDKGSHEFWDEHVWLSPVLKYDIYFKIPPNLICEAHERISDKYIKISQGGRQQSGEVHCFQPFSAFSRQGFRWKLKRLTPTT